jgi:hypothetical protein
MYYIVLHIYGYRAYKQLMVAGVFVKSREGKL